VTASAPLSGVIDVCGLHYDLAGWEAYLLGFARHAPGYLRKFGQRFCTIAGADPAVYAERLASDPEAAVAYIVDCGGGFDESFEAYATAIKAQGVTHQVLHGCPWTDRTGRGVNDYVAACAAAKPSLFSAWIGVPLSRPDDAVREIERGVRELGARGVTLIPFWEGVPASDPSCRPIFQAARDFGLPVWIHAGQNFNGAVTLDVSDCRNIDRVATEFPDLTLLIGHGGWPWLADAIAICQRHENVYLEFSSHRPAPMPRAGSCWEPLLFQAKTSMRDRVMFGTSAWVSPKSIAELADETRALPIPQDVSSLWLGGNAARALRLG